jgi:threonine dehydratase
MAEHAAPLVGIDEVRAAHERIRPHVSRTPLVAMADGGVLLKAESLQPGGSFKIRGAVNSMLALDDEQRSRGVVAHSSGNHAIAVARAGAVLGITVTVVMPGDAPRVKRALTEELGARVELVGSGSDERVARADELAVAEGLTLVEPYDSRAVLAATATIAVEILEDLGDLGSVGSPTIYVPVSGGGLAGGVAAGAKLLDPRVRIVAVEPEEAADFAASRRAGERVSFTAEQMARTAADGLRVQQVGAIPWPHLQAYVDEAVTVSEAEIGDAAMRIWAETGLVAEPSGAVSVAAALAAGAGATGPCVAVLTGANTDEPPGRA